MPWRLPLRCVSSRPLTNHLASAPFTQINPPPRPAPLTPERPPVKVSWHTAHGCKAGGQSSPLRREEQVFDREVAWLSAPTS
jgi:hypothetical protein